jgi:hypothetical protein
MAFDSVQAGTPPFRPTLRLETAGRAFVLLVLLASARGTAHAQQPVPQNVATVADAIAATGVNDLGPIVTYEVGGARIANSSGGFTFSFDPALGVPARVSSSFGPVFVERASTLGKGKYSIGLSFLHASYDKLDGAEIRNAFVLSGGESRIAVDQTSFAFFFSAGITNRLDLTAFVPFSSVTATTDLSDDGVTPSSSVRGSGSGFGDIAVRAKVRAIKGEGAGGLALLGEFRMPTGDEKNLLGLGQYQIKVGASLSADFQRVSPHASMSAAYLGNDIPRLFGQGDPTEVNHRELEVGGGAEVTPTRNFTASADLLFRWVAAYGAIGRGAENAMMWSLGVGAKFNVARQLLLGGSVLLPLGDRGLRDNFTPGIQFEYSF